MLRIHPTPFFSGKPSSNDFKGSLSQHELSELESALSKYGEGDSAQWDVENQRAVTDLEGIQKMDEAGKVLERLLKPFMNGKFMPDFLQQNAWTISIAFARLSNYYMRHGQTDDSEACFRFSKNVMGNGLQSSESLCSDLGLNQTLTTDEVHQGMQIAGQIAADMECKTCNRNPYVAIALADTKDQLLGNKD